LRVFVDHERRAQTFAKLREQIGITPEKLVGAGAKKI
jgi:hypothetical protein